MWVNTLAYLSRCIEYPGLQLQLGNNGFYCHFQATKPVDLVYHGLDFVLPESKTLDILGFGTIRSTAINVLFPNIFDIFHMFENFLKSSKRKTKLYGLDNVNKVTAIGKHLKFCNLIPNFQICFCLRSGEISANLGLINIPWMKSLCLFLFSEQMNISGQFILTKR